jgi:hypothetical protein
MIALLEESALSVVRQVQREVKSVKVELRFKPISAISTDYVVVTIEGEPQKVRELLDTVEEKAKTWESWEEK